MKDLIHNRRILNANFNSSSVAQEPVQSSYFYGVKNSYDNSLNVHQLNFRDPGQIFKGGKMIN
jgi:hypothetical protein